VAEQTGLILELGQWVLQEACAQLSRWRAEYLAAAAMFMSINISARQFRRAALVDEISAALRESRLPPTSVMLEITESSLIRDPSATVATLQALKRIGVRIAIDDFGTGYSGLSYLKQLPVDALKIDCSFVRDLPDDTHDRAITQSVVALAKAFSLDVFAEGVETEKQAAYLTALGCPQGQGWLFWPKLPAEAFARLLAEQDSAFRPVAV
jgi:EAL domain-containing protein (putative c-di-GMP-specific phosphodiesterase class I)